MNDEFVEDMVKNAPIFEMKLTTGESIVTEIVDIDTEDTTFMLYYPLTILTREGTQYLAKWFFGSHDPWVQIEKTAIIAYSECTLDFKVKYASTTLKMDGIDDLVPKKTPLSDESYH